MHPRPRSGLFEFIHRNSIHSASCAPFRASHVLNIALTTSYHALKYILHAIQLRIPACISRFEGLDRCTLLRSERMRLLFSRASIVREPRLSETAPILIPPDPYRPRRRRRPTAPPPRERGRQGSAARRQGERLCWPKRVTRDHGKPHGIMIARAAMIISKSGYYYDTL